MKNLVFALLLTALFSSCTQSQNDYQYELGNLAAFSEMVAAGVKPIALSEPMSASDMDGFYPEAEKVATQYNVSLYRESDLFVGALFPQSVVTDKEVLMVFRDSATLLAYFDLKATAKSEADQAKTLAQSRRLGRLLGYPTTKINQLLAENTDFRTLANFGIASTTVQLFYADQAKAVAFYSEILGLKMIAEDELSATFEIGKGYYLKLTDEKEGSHRTEEAKTVAVALLTDQLAAWYEHLQANNVAIKYTYKPKTDNAHDGFVAIDPEGYLLEFEMFKQHPENEQLMPRIQMQNSIVQSTKGPDALYFYGGVTWLYYKDMLAAQQFYEETIGLQLTVDQGWAKVYRINDGNYLGLVDERRGMHQFADQKSVNLKFTLKDSEGWRTYLASMQPIPVTNDSLALPRTFWLDPAGYFLEFGG
jgi:catechol-2,3-dioxygenase